MRLWSAATLSAQALFADLARGRSFAPLHAVAGALARGEHDAAFPAARTLAAVGHSSGWDMLAGLIIGVMGRCTGRAHQSGNQLARTASCF